MTGRRTLLALAATLAAPLACAGDAAREAPSAADEAAVVAAADSAPTADPTPDRGDTAGSAAAGAATGSSGGGGDPDGARGERPPPAVDPVVTRPADEEGEGGGPPARRRLPPPVEVPAERPGFERPEAVRGLYLNAWTAGSPGRVERFIDLAHRTEVNAFVIDIKDATGHVSHSTAVPLAREIGAVGEVRIHDLPGLLRRLSDEGIWPIARIVIVKDPILAEARPEWAIQDTAGGPWRDGKGVAWMNAHKKEVWDYHLALAREVAELGFPEIQWDYVRFPDAPSSEMASAWYPDAGGRSRPEAIRQFLTYAGDALGEMGVESTADVFGVTTSARDVGIGQIWEEFIDRVDVALPMVYPSHYWRGSFGYRRPNYHPYEIVREALERAVARSARVEGAGRVRPWLQDFSLGEPEYGAPEVRAQIQAAYDVGVEEWLLWNPSSRYTEEALRPEGGWRAEPMVRIGEYVVPVSERFEAVRMAEAEAARLDSLAAAAAADTAGSGGRP